MADSERVVQRLLDLGAPGQVDGDQVEQGPDGVAEAGPAGTGGSAEPAIREQEPDEGEAEGQPDRQDQRDLHAGGGQEPGQHQATQPAAEGKQDLGGQVRIERLAGDGQVLAEATEL